MGKRRMIGLLCALCFFGGLSFSHPLAEAGAQSNLRINGTVVGISGRFAGRSRPFTLIVNNYSAPNQVRDMYDALQRGGQDALLRAFSNMEVGRIQIGTGIGVPANVIIAAPWGEGGTKLTVLYRRNINFYELRYGTRSADYPVGYAEIFIDRNGKGEGTLIPAARVRVRDGNTLEVEDFGIFPARLMGLRASGRILPS